MLNEMAKNQGLFNLEGFDTQGRFYDPCGDFKSHRFGSMTETKILGTFCKFPENSLIKNNENIFMVILSNCLIFRSYFSKTNTPFGCDSRDFLK